MTVLDTQSPRRHALQVRSRTRTVAVITVVAAIFTGASFAMSKAISPTNTSATALQDTFNNVVRSTRMSVVEISSPNGLGSGVVYDTKGDIVTNAHVVGSAKSFSVSFSNGKTLDGHLVGTYSPDDLAVVRVTAEKWLRPATFGNSSELEVGDFVLAMGNPLGLSSSVTDGIVSFNGRVVSEGNGVVLPDLIQTSAAINPGNSGGALVDLQGQVVGIPTLAATNADAAAPGLGFAIPSNLVTLIAPQLITNGKVTTAGRATLGLDGADVTNSSGGSIGVEVSAVQKDGPAAKAGIRVGELITAINGQATPNVTTMETILAEMKPGEAVSVAILSPDGSKRTVKAVLADLAHS